MGEIEPVGSVEISIAGFVVGTGVGGCDSNVGLAVEKLGEHSEKFALGSLWTCLYLHLWPCLHFPCLVYSKQMG